MTSTRTAVSIADLFKMRSAMKEEAALWQTFWIAPRQYAERRPKMTVAPGPADEAAYSFERHGFPDDAAAREFVQMRVLRAGLQSLGLNVEKP